MNARFFLAASIIISILFITPLAYGTTNISSSTSQYSAWDDVSGWWDLFNTNSVEVQGSKMTGYASSSVGLISFDCGTSPNGNICPTSVYGVCNGLNAIKQPDGSCSGAEANGWLSGYAWSDTLGWISMTCLNTNPGCGVPGGANYWGVTIDKPTGDFLGYAWSDVAGWISFNCANNGTCGASSYKVNTSWRSTSSVAYLESAIIDTQSVGGATLNSILWKGEQNANSTGQQTYVDFQIAASSTSSGPWTFIGPSGTNADYYSASCDVSFTGGINPGGNAPKDTPICIDPSQVKNMRYIRYRVRLRSNLLQTDTPRIDDIILNWSK